MQAKEKTKTARIDISSQPKIIGPFIDGKNLWSEMQSQKPYINI
jgi:hypothetical protein